MTAVDGLWLGPALARVRDATDPGEKGRLFAKLVADIFCCVPGITLDDENVVSGYGSEEIDLIFWNDQLVDGLRFLDCPLIVECKGWSRPVPGRDVEYFASLLRHKGRRNGILVALNGVTGEDEPPRAAHFHVAVNMAMGVQVLVVTGADLQALTVPSDLVRVLKRKILDLTKRQLDRLRGVTG